MMWPSALGFDGEEGVELGHVGGPPDGSVRSIRSSERQAAPRESVVSAFFALLAAMSDSDSPDDRLIVIDAF